MEWPIAVIVVISITVVVAFLGVRFYNSRDVKYSVPERLYAVRHAMTTGRDLYINYFTFKRKKFNERTITPLEIRNELYLDAFDHVRREIRTFRISRMKDVREVPRLAQPQLATTKTHRRRARKNG